MDKYACKVSVIVPVYNVEEFLHRCVKSLIKQTIDKNKMEVILVNDASPDNSPAICDEYAQTYPFIKVVHHTENQGLSAARNTGIDYATGKYLMFLDSDDWFTPETVEAVTNTFDKFYHQVDAVSYDRVPIDENNQKGKMHFRYDIMTKEDVYDLTVGRNIYIIQTTVNICVKNLFQDTPRFSDDRYFRHEDQEWCVRVVQPKMKIAYCPKAAYMYYKNTDSFTHTVFHSYYLFEKTTAYFENVFNQYEVVPKYFQAMYIHDLIWKIQADILFPYHYENDKWEASIKRLHRLLERTDIDTIAKFPHNDSAYKAFLIRWRGNYNVLYGASFNSLAVSVSDAIKTDDEAQNTKVYYQDNLLQRQVPPLIVVHKLRVNNNRLEFMAFVKSVYYSFDDTSANVFAIENESTKKKLDVFPSVHSYANASLKIANYWAFRYSCDINEVQKIRFVLEEQNTTIQTKLWFMEYSGLNQHFTSIVRKNLKITNANNAELLLSQLSLPEVKDLFKKNTFQFLKHPRLSLLRLNAIRQHGKERIWLYYDWQTVEKDNGYYQFINDFQHDDGIKRYYVVTYKNYKNINALFTKEQKKYLVKFGSRKHKKLFLNAEYIFTAYFGITTTTPFSTVPETMQYYDILDPKIIYLQHGVLHADLYFLNAAERSRAEQIVVSTPFEKENLTKNYNYADAEIITTGMARYDYIDKNRPAKNRILFAPSWRKYLTLEHNFSTWNLQVDRLKSSDYYKNMLKFLEHPQLHKILEEKDYYLDIKLHPIVTEASDLFSIDSDRVVFAPSDVNVSDYKMFITDFSSYAFDFAYLSRAMMYFVPDYEQFKSGMNHYRKLDLPFEDAFGNMSDNPEDAVQEFLRLANQDFQPDEKFYQRMQQFFYPLENCAENLYQYIMNNESKNNN